MRCPKISSFCRRSVPALEHIRRPLEVEPQAALGSGSGPQRPRWFYISSGHWNAGYVTAICFTWEQLMKNSSWASSDVSQVPTHELIRTRSNELLKDLLGPECLGWVRKDDPHVWLFYFSLLEFIIFSILRYGRLQSHRCWSTHVFSIVIVQELLFTFLLTIYCAPHPVTIEVLLFV